MEPSTESFDPDTENWSFESDTEDWSPYGLMDHTLEEDISTPEEATALREFVQAYNTANPIPADEAARRLMTLREDRIPCDGLLDKGERVCWTMWDVGLAMPQHQTAILVLVDAVRALPRLEATPEQEARFGKKLELWRTLDKWDDIWHEIYHVKSLFRYSECCDYVRVCAFNARYLLLHPPDLECPTELHRAFWQIRITLEQDAWNYATPQQKAFSKGRSYYEAHITMLDTNVIAMEPFLKIAGHIIYRYLDREALSRRFVETHQENHRDNTREQWQRTASRVKPDPKYPDACLLWKGDVWLTRDRWPFWKERLVWISEQDELLQRTRDVALMLVQLMQEIETREA